jgi:hypothetical protein
MNKTSAFVAVVVMLGAAAFMASRPAPPPALDKDAPASKAWREWLAARRAGQLERLNAYAARAVFPKNRDFMGEQVPYFIDAEGVPCAVANLIIESGGDDLARRVSASDNHVRVGGLKDGPVVDWILVSGLLQEEAARIQPSYSHMRRDPERIARERELNRVRTHLREVETELREGTEIALDFAVGRLLERIRRDPAFGRSLAYSPSADSL